MRKFFTLFAAALCATSMFAAAEQLCFATLESIDKNNNTTGIPQTGCTMAWSKITSDKDFVEIDGHKYYKFSSEDSYVQLILNNGDKFAEGDVVTITVAANQEKKVSLAFGSASGNKTSEANVSNTVAGEVSRELVAADIEADGSIKVFRAGNSNLRVCSFTATRESSTDPVLNVSPAEVTLELTAAKLSDVAYVHFGGKNLTPGVYPISVPDLDGLRLDPSNVTVGDDGKLNEDVAIAYSSEVDVEANSTEIKLEIGELEAKVTVNYSASFAKNYLSKSVNIEQLVLDNGVSYDIASEFASANIEFENINALDSLNDEKDLRNEPYLGLKLKTQGAYVACWLPEGSTIRVKFGFVAETVIGSINGQIEEFTPAFLAEPLEFTAPTDCYMKLSTSSSKTVVIKQIMLNEEIAEVELPGSPSGVDNINADVQATKVIRDGQLLIEKKGVVYNAQGTVIK